MLDLQGAQARPDPSGGAGQHAGAVQSRGSMRLAAHRLGARALASVIWRRIHTYYVVIKHVLRVGFHVIRAHDTLRAI